MENDKINSAYETDRAERMAEVSKTHSVGIPSGRRLAIDLESRLGAAEPPSIYGRNLYPRTPHNLAGPYHHFLDEKAEADAEAEADAKAEAEAKNERDAIDRKYRETMEAYRREPYRQSAEDAYDNYNRMDKFLIEEVRKNGPAHNENCYRTNSAIRRAAEESAKLSSRLGKNPPGWSDSMVLADVARKSDKELRADIARGAEYRAKSVEYQAKQAARKEKIFCAIVMTAIYTFVTAVFFGGPNDGGAAASFLIGMGQYSFLSWAFFVGWAALFMIWEDKDYSGVKNVTLGAGAASAAFHGVGSIIGGSIGKRFHATGDLAAVIALVVLGPVWMFCMGLITLACITRNGGWLKRVATMVILAFASHWAGVMLSGG